ncbi:MAG: acyl-CoA dehydrogenase family protein [Dehalococcoidales bacterium]|nr:acyl-CoA dehydrogenase family protein [Dehalococcoidales bacterium]
MNLEHLLTEEQLQLRQTLRDFTKKEIMPITKQLDEDYSLVEKVHQKLVDMGIQASGYPEEYGGGGVHSMTTNGIIMEELSKGDAGMALSVGSNMAGAGPAAAVGNKAILDKFAPLFCQGKLAYGCLSMTDETGGADTENPLLHGAGIKTIAKLEGDEYVINGSKMWPTHGGIAESYITFCTTDPKAGDEGIAMIIVPKDATGLSFGKPEKKMLFKTVINGAVYYDNVRVPKEYRVAGPGMDANLCNMLTTVAGWSGGMQALGIAERAFDIVLEYTGTRMGGFKPVRQHSMVAGMIADMAIGIEMMRASLYNMAYIYDHPDKYEPIYGKSWSPEMIAKGAAARVFAADTAVEIINKGAELLGSMAISEGFPYEKCLRDVKICQLWLGGQQICRYKVAQGYYDLKNWA